ncbi:hypothetical protein PoB_006247100 [Plakobranchus ocellatus]|uniref:Uncharacterized protein n=1 Tax=Plakobranchus ocellatus TaxID=259542 RepID=A0AAV4CVM8_9GAST|nr:hypothetical protein PoB_006247100 [Plakobranchus ocellatus]
MAEEGSDKEPAELGRKETNCTNFPLEVQEPFNLQHLIDDDVFQALRKHFHMTGKGRRPDLPKNLVVTRGLLLQLYILKEESQESFKTLKVWLDKLAPELASVTEGRIKHRVTSIVESCKQMSQDVACQYLQAKHDFHALVGSLAELGLNRQHLLEGYNLPEQLPVEMVNNHVVVSLEQFRAKEKQPAAFVVKWLKTLSKSCASLTDKQVKYKSSLVITKAKTLSKNEKDMEALELFLKCDFPQDSVHQQTDDQCQLKCSECAILKQTIKKLERDYKLLETKVADLSLQNNIKDEICVDVKRLYQENSCLEASIKQLKNKLKDVYEYKKSMSQELERLKSSNMYRKNQEYKKSLEKFEDQKNHVMNELKQEQVKHSQFETTISTLKSKVKEEQNLKSYYKASFRKEKEKTCELNKMLTFDFENTIENIKIREDGSSHRYSDDVRKTFYALQGEANVPATNCSKAWLPSNDFFKMAFNLLSQLIDRSTNEEDEDVGSPVDDVGDEIDDESDVDLDGEEGEDDGLSLDSSDDDESSLELDLDLVLAQVPR